MRPTRRRLLGWGCAVPAAIGAARFAGAASGPIAHLVVILRENHSYDNYFGSFADGDGVVVPQHCSDTQPDPPHSRKAALAGAVSPQWRGDCSYLEADIPNYFAYARRFVLCDRYFAEIRGPSYPNYFALMGVSPPVLDNPRGNTAGRYKQQCIADRLKSHGVSWRNYDGGLNLVRMFAGPAASGNIVPVEQFDADAAAGALPAVSWVTPHISDSEHPPHSVRQGENWTLARINAVMRSPLWSRTTIIVVWDEWGGFADHVPPPTGEGESAAPVRYGNRVPCLVIGGYARRGYVSHTFYSHSSIVKTICRLFAVPTVSPPEEQANDLLDCLDYAGPPQLPLALEPRQG